MSFMKLLRRSYAIGIVATMLIPSACASPQAALSPTAAPAATASIAPTLGATNPPTEAAPTAVAPTEAAPTAAATAPSARDALLPAPLYYLDENQIWRLESDGSTRRQITFESEPIAGFELASGTNSLLYRIGENDNVRVVLLDESGRVEMMTGPLGYATIAPDATRIAVEVMQPIDGLQIGREGSDTGVFLQERTGGRPGVFAADPAPADGQSAPEHHYAPNQWSPDGTRLLITRAGIPGEGQLSIRTIGETQAIEIDTACCEAVWSADGSSLLVAGGIDPEFSRKGVWRVDAASGQAQPLFPDQTTAPLVTLPYAAADGTVLAFIDEVGTLMGPAQLKGVQIAADGSTTPFTDQVYDLIAGLWSPDGSGAAVTPYGENGAAGELLWLPSNGDAATPLGVHGVNLRWGNANAAPAPFACDTFRPLAWEPSGARQAKPEVADLQRRLGALGYLPAGSDDGLFGDQTRDALRAFQQANNLPASDSLDCATWQTLLGGRTK